MDINNQEFDWVQVAPHYRYTWIHDHRIFISQLTDVDRESVDAFIDQSTQVREGWRHEEPLRVLIDQRSAGMMTPYFRQSLQRLLESRPDLQTFLAYLLDGGIDSRMLEVSVRLMPKNPHVQTHVSESFDDAISWLLQES
ncbi:MAG: hypothetical protein CL607_09805 [Anaerolineaceae bacterium]|nr:hypothetical protein [Anaerolineaceae bacterium]